MLGVCPTFGEETRLACCGTACGYCFAILALPPAQIRSSAHISKRAIHLRYLLVQDVRGHQPADHTHDTATQTDDEQFPSPVSSEIISRTVQEQIAPLANLLRRTQEQSEAMAERCRNLEDRQSQVQLQDVSFSSAPPASDEDRQSEICQRGGTQSAEASATTLSRDSAVRTRASLNYQVDTTRTESSDHCTTHLMGKEMWREARRRELEAKAFGHWSPWSPSCYFALMI